MSCIRTYGNRARLPKVTPSSPRSSSPAPPTPSSIKRKRALSDVGNTEPPRKRPAPGKRASTTKKLPRKPLTQLHLTLAPTTFRTCSLCSLTYTQGAVDDEILHKSHCSRVLRGMEWGKEEEKEAPKAGVIVISTDVKLKTGERGRIISFRADAGGKIGSKLTTLLQTINLSLSAPDLPPKSLKASKCYLFLVPTAAGSREKIVGCVIAQRISSAMRVVPDSTPTPNVSDLIQVDGGLYCYPKPLPTTLGIPRVFVPSNYRRRGIARLLLDASAKTFIHGCPLDPSKGEVAFSQPTGMGRTLMMSWGSGGVRVFEE